MALSASSVLDIIRLKGSVVVNSSDYSATHLVDFARLAAVSGAHVTIRGGGSISAGSLLDIVRVGKGAVTIDLT